jgi:hypothetical protein
MANKKILSVFILFNLLFLCCGGLLLSVAILSQISSSRPPTLSWVAQNILLATTPLTAYIVDSVIIFLSVLLAIPAFFSPSSKLGKHLLTAHAYLALIAAIYTLGLGLRIWFSTLQSKTGLNPVWNSQIPSTQTLLQKKFNCCGYQDSAIFVKDATCSSVVRAAELGPCEDPFSQFADKFLDIVFTAFFGIAGVDMLLMMTGLCLMKERKEEVRYKKLDQKAGYRNI